MVGLDSSTGGFTSEKDHNSGLKFEAVVFDLGNTLMYFDGAWPEVIFQADQRLFQSLRLAGLDLGPEFLAALRRELDVYYQERNTEFIEHTTEYILIRLLAEWGYADVPRRVLRPALDAMYAVSQAHWLPEQDTIPTLQALGAAGLRLGLLSNASDDQDVQTLVDKLGIRPYLDPVLTSAALGIRKPNPRIFQRLLEGWGILPERTVMVGDTLGADILGARNAGMYSIWITRRADTPANQAHRDTIHPDWMVESLVELVPLLVGS